MRRPNPNKMVLRSDTRKVTESTQITRKGRSPGATPLNKSQMAFKNSKRRGGSTRSRDREDTHVRKEDRTVSFWFEIDIIWEILLRLPIEALLRCRCVCKAWCSMTKEPSFINMQLKVSGEEPPRFVCRPSYTSLDFYEDHLLLWDSEEGKTRKLPRKEKLFENRKMEIFSHNGLLCFISNRMRHRRASVVIYNPITKEYIKLPQSDVVKNTISSQVGFCFVPARQEHIAVRIFSTHDTGINCYILTSGQRSWRLITHPPLVLPGCWIGQTVYWNNAFHWRVTKFGGPCECILSFDTIRETFQVISYPTDIHVPRKNLNLLVLNGRLTLIESYENEMKMWEVMGDGVGKFSLVCREIYDIDDASKFSLVSRSNKNENLLWGLSTGFVIATNDMKQLRALKIDSLPTYFHQYSYNPSLVSVHSMGFPGYHLRF